LTAKRITSVLSFLAVVCLSASTCAQPKPTADQKAPPLVLARGGRSDYVIVVPNEIIPAESYAAKELSFFIEKMTGARLAIAEDGGEPREQEILLGATNARVRRLGVRLPMNGWGDDGFCIMTHRARLVLAGDAPRGTLYAVYEFLEEQGVRFFAPDVTRIPKLERLVVSPRNRVHSPAFRGRGHMLHCVQQSDNDWAVRLRCNSPWFGRWSKERGGNLRYGFAPHSFFHIIPPKKYFRDHSDWFSEIKGERIATGQLCLTNPGLLEEAIKVLLARMRTRPDIRFWDVSQMDNRAYCQCSECSALAKQEGSQSGPIIHFVNAIAERIEQEFPRNLITTFAYSYGTDPPRKAKARHNVGVRLCTIDKDCLRPMGASAPVDVNRRWAERFEGWAQHAEHLLVWDYGTNFADYMDIFPDYRTWQPNFQFYRDRRVAVVDMQGSYSAPYGELCYLRAYVIGKLLWDPSRDDRALVREYLDGVYGRHAELVDEFLDFCAVAAEASHRTSAMRASGWQFNKAGLRYEDLSPWRDKIESALAAEGEPTRVRHLKLLLLPIYKVLVEIGQPKLVKTAAGLEPDREISDDYRRTVDRLFELGRDFQVVRYREAAGDFETLEKEIRGKVQKQPYLLLESNSLLLRTLPGRGGVIAGVHAPARGTMRMRSYETYVGWKWHDPGWCEFYRIEESSSGKARLVANLSGQVELERTIEITGPRAFKVTEKLTSRGPEQIRRPLYSNLIFPMAGRDKESILIRQPDGSWAPGRFPNGRYEQMHPLGYTKGGGWALINTETGKGVAVRFTPEDIAIMGFWIDSSFSFQLITHAYRLDKDASAERTFWIEFLERGGRLR